jgi:hypothetical protein
VPLPLETPAVTARVTRHVVLLALLVLALGGACLAVISPGWPQVVVALSMAAGVRAASLAIAPLRRPHATVDASAVESDEPNGPWDGRERRGPNRARNVARLRSRAADGRSDTDDDQWEAF